MAPRRHVGDRLLALLVRRGLAAGDRLPPERALAVELGVARSSLREGKRRLADLGIIEPRQGSGTYLAPVDLADLLAVRMQLEPYAARLAALRRDGADLARLDALLAEMGGTIADLPGFADADLRLHATVAEAARSGTLRILLAAIADLLRYSRATTVSDAQLRRGALEVLGRLVTAIRDGDPAGAEDAMRTHLTQVGAALSRRPEAPDAGPRPRLDA